MKWEEKIVGFIAILHMPHPSSKKIKRVHRLVILPDYQGFGLGTILLNTVGKIHKDNGNRFLIKTSNPALFTSLKHNGWKLIHAGRTTGLNRKIKVLNNTRSSNRNTYTFEL